MDAIAWVLGVGIFTGLLLAYPRRMGVLLASIVAVVALGGTAIWGYFSWQEAAERRMVDSLNFQIAWAADECGLDHPLKLTALNQSGRELLGASFRVTGYREGFSNPLYATGYAEYRTDVNDGAIPSQLGGAIPGQLAVGGCDTGRAPIGALPVSALVA